MIEPQDLRVIEDLIGRALSARRPSINMGNDTVKSRHIGEGVRFVRCGLAAARPTSGEKAGAIYFATDTFSLSIYTGSAWKAVALS